MAKKRFLRTQLVTLRLPREALKRLDVMALEREKYRSELIVEALEEYLARDRAHAESARRKSDAEDPS